MYQEPDGTYVMDTQLDIFGIEQDPNLSGDPFQLMSVGDGALVKLNGFGIGDPAVVRAPIGSNMRAVPTDRAGAEPRTDEQKAAARLWLYIVQANGDKMVLGQVPEIAWAPLP